MDREPVGEGDGELRRPPPPSLAEMVHESEAFQLQQERRKLRIQSVRAHMAVQVLEGHNRLLQHLLLQERRKSSQCPEERTSGHCPHAAPVGPATCVTKCTVKTRSAMKIIQDLKLLWEPKRFTNKMDFAERQRILEEKETAEFCTYLDWAPVPASQGARDRREIHFIEEGATASGGRSGSLPLLTRTDADGDPSDPRNYEEDEEEDSSVSDPEFPDEESQESRHSDGLD